MMNPTDMDELDRRMGEAAVLRPDDPRRLEVERDVAAAGDEMVRRWLGLLCEDGAMRLSLGRVDMPMGMEGRLLAVPGRQRSGRLDVRRYTSWVVGVAALVMLVLGGTWLMSQWRTSDRLHTLSLLALNNHLNQPPLLVQSSDPDEVEAALKGQLPFPVEAYKAPPGLRLVGGGTCFVGGHRAGFFRYENGRRPYTLLLMSSSSANLPRGFARVVETPNSTWADPQRYRVAIWPDADIACAWMLVIEGDEPRDPFVFAMR